MDDSIINAVKFIDEKLKDNPITDKNALIEEACHQFDLNPVQGEFLINKFVLNS